MTYISCITFEINTLENIHSNHVSIPKTKRPRIRGRTNIATKGSTIFRKVERVSYHEKYVKTKEASYELLEGVEEVSRKSRDVRDQSSNTFDKATYFERTSMIDFGDKATRSSWPNSSMFCNSTSTIVCCSFSTNSNCCIKRCCLATSTCCFAIVARSSAFSFLRCSSSRRYRPMSRGAKSQA